ncbi:hypothetical protein [Henriciella sp.]|uniref:hypothetical protein n=1 Tax=Henriciella sp. TaxID=1968823 RepID=UPI0026163196|nr:hypothetical protein [Henriciella sp.]
MAIQWADNVKDSFGRTLVPAEHSFHNSPLFSDAALAALLDMYPREHLGIWTFAEHGEGEEAPVRGEAPGLSGEELLDAVRSGRIWLNLRAVNHRVSDYAGLSDTIFDSLQTATGHRIFKRDMGVLISSPNVHVHYHLDIPMVTLFQVRGQKTVWFYPPTSRFAPDEKVEAIVLKEQEEGLAFSNDFEADAREILMKPGMAVSWPQTAPHRVSNGGMMNVSLSCEFMTLPALLRANALYANGRLRRRFGAHPKRPDRVDATTLGKAALARILKKIAREPRANTPTPPTFQIDPSAPGYTRMLDRTLR